MIRNPFARNSARPTGPRPEGLSSGLTAVLTAIALCCALTVTDSRPVMAQDNLQPPMTELDDQTADDGDSGNWLEGGAQDLFSGLLREVEPQIAEIGRELGLRFDALSPILSDLGKMMDDIGNYQRPERLANGDILIRRKPGAPPPPVVNRRLEQLVEPTPDEDQGLERDAGPDRDPAPADRPLIDRSGAGEVEL